ncbi:MAG: glycosyltransferase family 2 protein [Myxococcota bacterium]
MARFRLDAGAPGVVRNAIVLPELSIVLPCFNEAAVVASVVREACTMGRKLAERFEVVVVDDGSVDDTESAAAVDKAVRVIRHPTNRGYGAALASGFRAARYRWVFYTDGDGQFALDQLDEFLKNAEDGTVLAGYRSPRADGSLLRTLNGRGWTALTNATLGLSVRDVNCAFKLFPVELLRSSPMRSRGAAIDAELLFEARRRGMRIVERPVTHRPRTSGEATGARPKVIARALWELGALRARAVELFAE